MNVLAILKDFTRRCKSVFENTTTTMSKRFLNWLILTIRTVALIPGKVNFTRLSRYGGRTAKTFSSNFKTPLDWLVINERIARKSLGDGDIAIAIDPSFISKAGKLTYGIGKFWSGVAQRVKRGLEIMTIGAISLSKHSCVMLGAVQSPNFKTLESDRDMSMLEWYISLVRDKAKELLALSDILVADAFFTKYGFVSEVVAMGFRFVGRLRADSYLRYLAVPDTSAPRKRGRKKMYGDKVDFSSLDTSVFSSFIYKDAKGNESLCHTAVVHSRALKRNIRIVVCPVENGEPLLYFSTDVDMEPSHVIGFYRTRFQIEFGIRDAKTVHRAAVPADPRQGQARLCFQPLFHDPQCLQGGHPKGLSRSDGPTVQETYVRVLSRLNNYFDLRKIAASQNNSENKPSVGSVGRLDLTGRPLILPNHCEKGDGIIEYRPTNREGESQGVITYTPEMTEEKFGTVTLSSKTPIFSFRKILIIPESLFPYNLTLDENINLTVYEDKIGGKVIEHREIQHRPDKEYVGFIITDREWATCEKKYVIFVLHETISGKEDICNEAPVLGELHRIGKWIKEAKDKHGVDIYQKFKEEGIYFDEKTVFWAYQTCKPFPWIWTARWADDLRGKQKDWWNIDIKDPYKRFMYVRKI